MKNISKYLYIAIVALLSFSTVSCVDDLLDDPGFIPDGETDLTVEVDFTPFSAMEVRSFQTNVPGNHLSNIDDLLVLIYDSDGKILPGEDGYRYFTKNELTIHPVKRDSLSASNRNPAEAETQRATFTLKNMSYGRYYMYALANIGKVGSNGVRGSSLDAMRTNFAGQYETVADLLAISVDWDNSNVLNNSQMFGVFTDGRGSAVSTPDNDDPDSNPLYRTITINRSDIMCHSWLRRCASKITIDFDGSELLENTYVYFKQATVHDIAKSCKLGMRNQIRSESEMIRNRGDNYGDYPHNNYRPDGNGTRILYSTESDYLKWPHVAKGQNSLHEFTDSLGNKVSDYHSETAPALYLFENMQGKGTEGVNDKEMKPNDYPDQTVDGKDEEKDNMQYGSYIEVEGYYDYHTSLETSKGRIFYRFMLGKDTKINFDTERNYHYKLTLKVRGKGNDYDWHIEYKEKEGFQVRDPYFISYLYNHSSTIPFKYTPENPNWEVYKVEAEVVANNWWPDGDEDYANSVVSTQTSRSHGGYYYSITDDDFTKNEMTVNGRKRHKYLGNGFLSLWEADKTNLTTDDTGGPWGYDAEYKKALNDDYYYGINGKGNGLDRGLRVYYFDGEKADLSQDASNTGKESYTMRIDRATGGYDINIPMFTRAKNLVKSTSYSGSNPFMGHTRTAFIRLKVFLRDKTTKSHVKEDKQIVRVVQVKRVVNPAGIYRESGNNESFRVDLMELESAFGSQFNVIHSRGPWIAEVIGSDDFIKLNGRHKVIRGSTDTPVTFDINFNKMNLDNTVRSATVRIRYNNYTCVHLIHIRQGYQPQMLAGTKWRISNLRHGNLADTDYDPRDEGSLFKRNNLTQPIHPISNIYNNSVGVPIQWQTGNSSRFPNTEQSFHLCKEDGSPDTKLTKWTEFDGTGAFTNSNMVTMKDFSDLYSNPHIEFNFGVLYADGATRTADNIEDAYGYYYGDPDCKKRGMRGLFAYYWNPGKSTDPFKNDPDNAKSIFFPIGRAGYGHRKTLELYKDADNKEIARYSNVGVLRYSTSRANTFPVTRLLPWSPLFYDLFLRQGAIYWAKDKATAGIYNTATGLPLTGTGDETDGAALDINFFTYDVNYISLSNVYQSSLSSKSDACFVRLKAN